MRSCGPPSSAPAAAATPRRSNDSHARRSREPDSADKGRPGSKRRDAISGLSQHHHSPPGRALTPAHNRHDVHPQADWDELRRWWRNGAEVQVLGRARPSPTNRVLLIRTGQSGSDDAATASSPGCPARALSTRRKSGAHPGNAVVDGVLDGGREANRRTTGHQAEGKHQILGREQHRRTTAHQADDQRQTTDLAVGGSSPSRRATSSQVSRHVSASLRSS